MSDDQDPGTTSFGRMLLIAVLVIATLGFGAAGLCGAAFSVMALPDVLAGRTGSYAGAVFVFSVPSLLIGGLIAWLCVRKLLRLRRGGAA